MKTRPIAALDVADITSFGYSEHLLLWSWRRIATGRAHCPVMAREFANACGDDAAEVFLTLCTFLKALAFASRRQLTIGTPGCLGVTADERQVLTLIAAAQGDTLALFEAHLSSLSRPDLRHVLTIAAGAMATALKMHGLLLALPAAETPVECEQKLALA